MFIVNEDGGDSYKYSIRVSSMMAVCVVPSYCMSRLTACPVLLYVTYLCSPVLLYTSLICHTFVALLFCHFCLCTAVIVAIVIIVSIASNPIMQHI